MERQRHEGVASGQFVDQAKENRLRGAAHFLLVPALGLFSLRAGMTLAGDAELPGWSLALVGIMSGAAMLSLSALNWRTADKWRTIAAVGVALLGHYVVRTLVNADLGGAMVYLGTGFLISLRIRWAQFAGMVAGIGALLRSSAEGPTPQIFLIIGALSMAIAAVMAYRPVAPKASSSN